MKKILEILNDIKVKGLIEDYAIAGGIATIFYTEPVYTYDLDIFIAIRPGFITGKVISLSPIYECFTGKGYGWKGEHIIVEGVPVQFILVDSDLEKDALKDVKNIVYEQTKTKILKPEYLIAIFLKTGRNKDFEKINRMLKQSKIDREFLNKILKKHNLYHIFNKKCLQHLK